MNADLHKRLVAAHERLRVAERQSTAAAEVHNNSLINLQIAENALEDAQRMARTNFVLLMSERPRSLSVSAARDAHATAKARYQKAAADVRAATKEVEEARKELEAAREAFADGGSWSAVAAMWHAEAQRLEQAARDARAEAHHAEQKHASQNDITNLPIAVLNRMATGGSR